MKKYTAVFLAAIMCMLTGCGEKSVLQTNTPPSETVADTSDIALPELTEEPIPTPTPAETVDPAAMHSTKGIDVDLTQLSSTMIYAEVYNMMITPDEYVGKAVRMEGQYAPYHDEETGKDYFACIIQDATACCSQGIEFDLTDKYSYPKDYPKKGENICVTGIFETYKEDDSTYCVLKNASLEAIG
ncbi:MAG: hypothetical protein IJ807_04815 [Eubacterium sp.]|nr:hypothetical protein [Eubacterium sp.]